MKKHVCRCGHSRKFHKNGCFAMKTSKEGILIGACNCTNFDTKPKRKPGFFWSDCTKFDTWLLKSAKRLPSKAIVTIEIPLKQLAKHLPRAFSRSRPSEIAHGIHLYLAQEAQRGNLCTFTKPSAKVDFE